jgi:mannose-6-phosphate isomerase-like protein (cupin superfamily)
MSGEVFDLARFPVHLGRGATVTRLDEFDGTPGWYERYGAAHLSDDAEGRLVSFHTFSEPWDTWEVHPDGHELVVCVEGRITLRQEIDGDVREAVIEPGQAVVNPPGAWHTADVDAPASALFITAGLGTQVRPR